MAGLQFSTCTWLLQAALTLPLVACQPTGPGPESPAPAKPQQATPPEAEKGALIALDSNLYGRYKWAQDAPKIGAPAPDFTLPLVDGTSFNLTDARKDSDVVVVFYRGFW